MDELSERIRRNSCRTAHNEEFVRRLFARRPEARQHYQPIIEEAKASPEFVPETALSREEAGLPPPSAHQVVLETIVSKERPVLFVNDEWLDLINVTAYGVEAETLVRDLNAQRAVLQPKMPLVGRIDVTEFPGSDFVGTGWFVDADIIITNRHVANLIARWDGRKFAFIRGVNGQPITSSVNTLHEFDDVAVDSARVFAVKEVIYIEREHGPDIAFLRVDHRTDGTRPDRITIATNDIGEDVPVFVVGYPARASKRVMQDQELMKNLYRDRYDVKRAAPGFSIRPEGSALLHDCTTLGGNSGSVVLDLKTGEAVGLHFAGLYQEKNYAVPASVLNEYVNKKRWNNFQPETHSPANVPKPQTRMMQRPKPQAATHRVRLQTTGASGGAVTVTIPLSITITVSLGPPTDGTRPSVSMDAAGSASAVLTPAGYAAAEAAAQAFWDQRPDGVIAARVGFFDQDDTIGKRPYIAASVPADRLAEIEARGPAEFLGFDVRYLAAHPTE